MNRHVLVLFLALVASIVCPAVTHAAAKTPIEAAALVCQYGTSIAPELAARKRYVWCPGWYPKEMPGVSMVQNIAISQTPVDIRPFALGGGSVAIIDLRVCAPDDADYERLVKLWASLSEREPWFHVKRKVRRKVSRYKARDGKEYDFEYAKAAVYADHLGEYGPVMEELAGNPNPEYESYCPIVHVGWFVKELLNTADGGRYYDFRNIVDTVKLDQYLEQRGLSKDITARIGSDERAACISQVTAKARGISVFQGQGTRPSVGAQICMITDDPFDDTTGAEFDPFRQLLDAKTNGHEVLVTLPSGWIEYTIWDAAGNLVKEAPGNLVADHRIPEPYTKRLQGAISCIRCHGDEDGWKNFVNEVPLMLGDRLRVYGDLSQKDQAHPDDEKTLKRLAGLYSGDLSWAVSQAQDNYTRRVHAATRLTVPEASKAVADIYAAYEYQWVTAAVAVKELGFELEEGDKNGVKTFRKIVPPRDPHGRIQEDPIIGRLHIEYADVRRQERVGLTLTRRQWEQVLADCYIRAYLEKAPQN